MIRFSNVSKKYTRKIQALNDVSFHIEQGEFVFLIGPSGAGKTTIMKLLLKEENPDTGQIFIDGKDVTTLRRRQVAKLRKDIGDRKSVV